MKYFYVLNPMGFRVKVIGSRMFTIGDIDWLIAKNLPVAEVSKLLQAIQVLHHSPVFILNVVNSLEQQPPNFLNLVGT